MSLLDRLEVWDKENYDKVFNKFKTVFCKNHKGNFTDEQIRERLENELEIGLDSKVFYNLWDDDLAFFAIMWVDLYDNRIR